MLMVKRSEVKWPKVMCEECFTIHDGEEAMKSPLRGEMVDAVGTQTTHQHINFLSGEAKWYCSHECCNHSGCVPIDHPKASRYRKERAAKRGEC